MKGAISLWHEVQADRAREETHRMITTCYLNAGPALIDKFKYRSRNWSHRRVTNATANQETYIFLSVQSFGMQATNKQATADAIYMNIIRLASLDYV